jgi:integrase
MTLTPVTDTDPIKAGFGAWRDGISAGLGNFSDLGTRPWCEVRQIEIFPGSRLGDAVIAVPKNWLPAGATRRESFRIIDLTPNVTVHNDKPEILERRDESIRRAMLALLLPRQTQTGIRSYKPTSWIHAVRQLLRIADWQSKHRPSLDGSVFSHLSTADLLALYAALDRNGASRLRRLIRWLIDSGTRGVLIDYPLIFAGRRTNEQALERSHKGEPASYAAERPEERNYRPFPDVFVTELIRRALWFQQHLADPLLKCWSDLIRIAIEEQTLGRSSGHPAVIARRETFILMFDWKDQNGFKIDKLPFLISQRIDGKFILSNDWPPRDVRSMTTAVAVLQALNFCTVAFCTGARMSEIAAAQDDALGDDEHVRFHSRTFKLVPSVTGADRDWSLHPVAVRAIEVQRYLARLVRPPEQSHLWVMVRHSEGMLGAPLLNLTEPIVAAVKNLGLTHLTGVDRSHAHRWRHTVARLVALSVIGAPQVLLDLFGHRDLEMTLRYMLSDPEIAAEAVKVAREIRYVVAQEAIAETLAGETTGSAAAALRERSEELRMRRAEGAYGTDTLRETAEVLTFGGKFWEIVRPGVICTKSLGEFGPCTKQRGLPDPGACRTDCTHRLEMVRAKHFCEQTLRMLLGEHSSALAEGAPMLIAHIEGQVLSNLKRWDEVRQKVIAEDATARRIWERYSQ